MAKYYSEYWLIQFKDKGRIITYLPDYPNFCNEGLNIYAVFRVKLKDTRTWFQKTFLGWKWRKYWDKHLVASQQHSV